MLHRYLFPVLAALAALPAVFCAAGNLVPVTEDFGANPTNVQFNIYVPKYLQANPPILVCAHWCQGSAAAIFNATQFATLSDTYGYIIIYPESPRDGKCWDVSSSGTLSHDGGGDSLGIISMVKWTLAKYNGNARRVFSVGKSSGAMMTNVLVGSYPDVFAGGSVWAGVPFGCFAGSGIAEWNPDCAAGKVIKTGAQWRSIVHAAYPVYNGWRPKVQSFHGTSDIVIDPQNLQEQIKQWTTVLGLPSRPIRTVPNSLSQNWTTYVYGGGYTATSALGVGHEILPVADTVLDFFDLKCRGTRCFCRPPKPYF